MYTQACVLYDRVGIVIRTTEMSEKHAKEKTTHFYAKK